MAITVNDSPFFTVLQVAKILNLSRCHTYQMVAEGQIPSTKFGSAIRVPRAWIERRVAEAMVGVEATK